MLWRVICQALWVDQTKAAQLRCEVNIERKSAKMNRRTQQNGGARHFKNQVELFIKFWESESAYPLLMDRHRIWRARTNGVELELK